jgi:prepilin-type N-terminal cleavage/methylation domain-containing protein
VSRGISLLELLVVLALLSVLAGFAVLNHQAMRPGIDLRLAARQVVMDLRLARVRAVAENVSHRIVFPIGAGAYQHQRKAGASYADDGPAVPLPGGIRIADCNATGSGISFKPRGNAATFGTVILHNRVGEERRVIVDIAGQTRVQ